VRERQEEATLRFFNGQRKRGENAKAKERKKANKKDGEKQRRSPNTADNKCTTRFSALQYLFFVSEGREVVNWMAVRRRGLNEASGERKE